MNKRLILPASALLLLLLASGCSAKDNHNTTRGRGDAPVGSVDNTPKHIVQFPDRFGNIATACISPGIRVVVNTRGEANADIELIADPNCHG